MSKRKTNEALILVAEENALLQAKETVSQAKPINGETFREINVDDIINNPMQPRININDDHLYHLARSIKLHGLIQPITVINNEDGTYTLKAGQRRWLAHKKLGIQKIKAIVQDKTILPKKESEKNLFEIAVLENDQRESLDPLELALSLRQALDKGLYKNQEELAVFLSRSKSYVTKILKVLSLDEEIIDDLRRNKSTNDIDSLYQIQKIENKQEQVKTYFGFINNELNRSTLREIARKKVLHTKPLYSFTEGKESIKLELSTIELHDKEKEDIIATIKAIIKKYF